MADIEKREEQKETGDSRQAEVLKEAPKEILRMQRTMQGMMMSVSGQMNNSPLMEKITEQNIEHMLDNQREGMLLEHKDNKSNRVFLFAVVLVVAALIAVILLLFRDKPDMVEKILYAAGGLLAGAVGGYGYGKSKRES